MLGGGPLFLCLIFLQVEKHLGSFSKDLINSIKEFSYLNLTLRGLCVLLSPTLTPEKTEDDVLSIDGDFPMGVTTDQKISK